jgi:TonB family protein
MKGNPLWRAVVISTVLSLAAWAIVGQEPRVALPMLASAQVPLYPSVARIANVEGIVRLKVTTDGHRVISVQVADGHKLLSAPAEENIRTWQFSPHEPTTFTVTYTYKLVADLEAVQNNPRVLLKLPTEVEVDALRWPGTVDTPAEVKRNPAKPTTR